MSCEFRVVPHSRIPGSQMVECWRDGKFVAAIYHHRDGIRIVSKYMTDVSKEEEPAHIAGQWLAAAIIKLGK